MAGRFRFTPACCCGYSFETNVCVPDCTVIADRIVPEEEISDLVDDARDARYCDGEAFWHGFRIAGNKAYPLTDTTQNGSTCRYWVAIYYNSARVLADYRQLSLLATAIDNNLSDTRTATSINNYFVYSSIDEAWHYRPNVAEPAWVHVHLVPFDLDSYPFAFQVSDDTQAAYEAAPEVALPSASGYFLTYQDCGVTVLPVDGDFSTNNEAWSQFHTGVVGNYTVSGVQLQSWFNTLTGHCGSDRFYVTRVYMEKTSWAQQSGHVLYNPPRMQKTTVEGRFYRTAPPSPAILPVGTFLADYDEPQSSGGLTGVLSNEAGSNANIPLYWKKTPYETQGNFFGRYYAFGLGVSYRSAGAYAHNVYIPLGKYQYTPPASTAQPNPTLIHIQTAPVYLAAATRLKTTDQLTAEEIALIQPSVVGEDMLPSLILHPGSNTQPADLQPNEFACFWTMPEFYVAGTYAQHTPPELIDGGNVFTHGSVVLQKRFGIGTVLENGVESPILTQSERPRGSAVLPSARPNRASDYVDPETAGFQNFDITNFNRYYEMRRLTSLRPVASGDHTYYVPSIPSAVREATFPDGSYVMAQVITDQAGKTFYYYPLIRVSFGATYL